MVSMATINLVHLTSRTFISQVRDDWVLFVHSHTQSGPLPQLHHRVSSSAELWSDFTTITPALKLPWPGFHIISSCQRNGCSRWGSLSFSTCECRQPYQSPLLCWERIFIADNMCILFITFLQNFYVLILFSNHIIFQRIGKSGNLFSLINEKKHSKTLVLCTYKKNIKGTICCGSLLLKPHIWYSVPFAMEMGRTLCSYGNGDLLFSAVLTAHSDMSNCNKPVALP